MQINFQRDDYNVVHKFLQSKKILDGLALNKDDARNDKMHLFVNSLATVLSKVVDDFDFQSGVAIEDYLGK